MDVKTTDIQEKSKAKLRDVARPRPDRNASTRRGIYAVPLRTPSI